MKKQLILSKMPVEPKKTLLLIKKTPSRINYKRVA